MHPRLEPSSQRHSYSSVRTSYFAVRVINVRNALPADRADFSSFAAFKRTVQQIDVFIISLGLLSASLVAL